MLGRATGSMMLREATDGDARRIAAVHVASWRETYAGLMPDEMLSIIDVDARATMWSRVLADPRAAGCVGLFVVEDQGNLIGFGACGLQRDEALAETGFSSEIGALYVLRSHHGRGVGRSLMVTMARTLLLQAHRAVSLWVLRENVAARTFYTALEAEPISKRADEQSGATLVEIAYGWRDLSRLLR